MDPATIVGTTSAILSFIQFAGKVISVACKIHDNSDGAFDDNRNLEDAVTDFQIHLESLRPTCESSCSADPQVEASGAKTHAEKSLLTTAGECESLGNKILEVLDKTKARAVQVDEKKPSSLLRRARKHFRKDATDGHAQTPSKPTLVEGIRASIQTVWQKDKLGVLRQQWEGCVIRLNIDLQRLDADDKHDIICAAFERNSEQISKIQDLVQSLVHHTKISKLECLQSFLDDFGEADAIPRLEMRNTQWILRALEFEGMNARREQVETTVGKTFQWLMTDSVVPHRHPDLKVAFKKWLSDGTGVYHVAGKLGSGKSTLMKLINQAAATQKQLQDWASRAGERLVVASFYTWKAASAHQLQKQEEGLTRTLLHQILTAAPELARVAFANHSCWNLQEHRLINILARSQGISAKLHFEPKEVLAALESILRIQGYKFFLLIDGMDEFEKEYNHRDIAKRVLQWSSHNSNRVKICVSSREDNAFMNTFSADQRLRLHIVTEKDVRELIETRLMEHDHFLEATEKDRKDLVDKIAEGAEGVFLWVVLTIQELKPLMDDRQRFQMLLREVDGFPTEMEEFLREILSRIPARYKKEADAIFCVATSTLANEGWMSLFHYSMLRKCLELGYPNVDKNPRQMSSEEVTTHLQDFRLRLPSVCRGLLEINGRVAISILYEDLDERDKSDTIQSTHRSVFEFLRSYFNGNPAEADSGLHWKTRGEVLAISSAIEATQAISWEKNKRFSARYQYNLWRIVRPSRYYNFPHNHMDASIFPVLMALEAVVLRKQGAIAATIPFNSTALKDIRLGAETISLFLTAMHYDYHQYIDWASKNYPPWILTQEAKASFVEAYFHNNFEAKPVPIKCLTRSDWLPINEPILANRSLIPEFSPIIRGSMWVNFMILLMINHGGPNDSMPLHLHHVLLAGAEPRIRFKWWSQQSLPYYRHMSLGPEFGLTVEVGDSYKPQRIQGPQWPGEEDTRLIRFCVKNFCKMSGTATLRDVLEILLKSSERLLLEARGFQTHERKRRRYEQEQKVRRRCLQAVDEALPNGGKFPSIDPRPQPDS